MKKKTKIIFAIIGSLVVIGAVQSIINPDSETANSNTITLPVETVSSETVTSTDVPLEDIEPSSFVDKTPLEDTESEPIVLDFSAYDVPYENVDTNGLNVKHGELLSVIYSDGTVVVKVKIEPSFSNQATIDQNYFNVADLVKNHGFNTCEKLSYWAVADMTNGEESKCISFDLNKETVDNLYNGNIVENQLGEYATDLWILPSLQH